MTTNREPEAGEVLAFLARESAPRVTPDEYAKISDALASLPEELRARALLAVPKPERVLPASLSDVDLGDETTALVVPVPLDLAVTPMPPFVDERGFRVRIAMPSYCSASDLAMLVAANDARLEIAARNVDSRTLSPALVHAWRARRTCFTAVEGGPAKWLDFHHVTDSLGIKTHEASRLGLPNTLLNFIAEVATGDPILALAWADDVRAKAMGERDPHGWPMPTVETDARGQVIDELFVSDLERVLFEAAAHTLNALGKSAAAARAQWRRHLAAHHASRAA